MKIIPVILCGGSGTRLFPISTDTKPKQFLPLTGIKTMLQQTITRTINCCDTSIEDVTVTTLNSYKNEVTNQISELFPNNKYYNLILEPYARNTAAAILYSSLKIAKKYKEDQICWFAPSDHFITDEDKLKTIINLATKSAENKKIVTFGIKPHYPETAYGYISHDKTNNIIKSINNFVEKPDIATAYKYIKSGNYLWNSGMFIAQSSVIINNYKKHAPNLYKNIINFIKYQDSSTYKNLDKIPFDKAIMEKTKDGTVIECNLGWSDIGCHQKLDHIYKTNHNIKSIVIDNNPSIYDSNQSAIKSN